MGSSYVQGFFEAGVEINSIMEIHLRYNNFPPINPIIAPAVLMAVEEVAQGNYDRKITLPEGRTFTAKALVDATNSWDFVENMMLPEEDYDQ